MKIYISGKISGLSEKEYKYNFFECQDIINHKFGCEWINPLDIHPFLGVKSWFCYMVSDLLELQKCTHIAMQKNWVDSKCAVVEYYFAKIIFKLQIIWL